MGDLSPFYTRLQKVDILNINIFMYGHYIVSTQQC